MNIIVNDQLLEYTDQGSGKVILMLHGWGSNLNTFDQLANCLLSNFRVIRFDFPGFGKSPKPDDKWAVANYAQITSQLLQKLKISDLYAVIAHSFGGRITIKGISMGILQPQKVILIGAAGIKPSKSVKKSLFRLIAKVGRFVTSLPGLKNIQPKLRKNLYVMVGSSDYIQADKMKKIFVNIISEDLLSEIKNISQPTLLIWGENDKETPIKDANLMLSNLKNGRLIKVEGAGHFVYIEAFDRVRKEIEGFLA